LAAHAPADELVMSESRIPFNRPVVAGREVEYISNAIARGHISGDGFYTKKCHEVFEEILPGSKVLLTTSCTHALELAALLLSIGPGDEVVVPSFTFVSTINAFVLRGARPIFLDIRGDTLNLDERLLASRITPRTKAIVPVHYAGVGCEMDQILRTAADRSIPVVEDNAHGLFGTYRGRPLGTIGRLATLSFHETKNLTCGEGGALLVNDPELLPRAEILREKGTNRSRFFRGQVDKYTWMDVGSSYLPSDMLAAFLYGQLEVRVKIQNRRQAIWQRYAVELADWAASRGVRLPHVPQHCVQPGHLFFLLLPDLETRQRLVRHLDARCIHAVFHYLPLHLSEMGRRFGGKPGDCPVTEEVSDRLLRLPLYYGLSDDDQTRVLNAVREF
jgi:dTDP-4-amino-4,6-dideoxygalactose transaminase